MTFIPHGATCEADHDNGSDWGRCGEYAVGIVTVDKRDHYVCREHLRRCHPLPVQSVGDATKEEP